MYLDDAPRLRRRLLIGAAVPGKRTVWVWEVGDVPRMVATGADGAVVLEGEGLEPVRVTFTKHRIICPHCSGESYMLVFNQGWKCRSCCGLKYRSRAWPHPVYTRRSILYRLARSDPGIVEGTEAPG